MSENDNLKKFLNENRPKPFADGQKGLNLRIWHTIEQQNTQKDRSFYWVSATACSFIVAGAAFWNMQRTQLSLIQPQLAEPAQIEMKIDFHDDEKISEVDALLALGS